MSKNLTVHSPYDLSELGSLPFNTAEEVERYLEQAYQITKQGKTLPIHQRTSILEKAAGLLDSRRSEFALGIAQEGGKPLSDAEVEAARAVQGIHNAIETINHMRGEEIPMSLTPSSEKRLAFTTREPIGVVVAVSAFNHPLNLIIHQVVPAIATGCPVIVKPAGATPLSCIRFVELLREAGLPEEYCQVMILDNQLGEKLVTDPRVAFFSFIGSSRVGWMLHSKLAPGARAALEHGGAAPVIVEQDADLDRIVPLLVKGGYYHAGQVCVSVQRIFAHEKIAEDLITAISEQAQKLITGDPTQKETQVGPLIFPREVDRVESWVNAAQDEGAKLICGGKRISDTCYQPTLLANPSLQSQVSTSEVFGPVVTVNSFSDRADAITWSNQLPVAFQAAVFTQDIDNAFYYSKRLDASAVMVNDHTAFRVDWMPFAGRRTSGLGTGGIPHTMHEMTQEKMFVFHSPSL